MLEMQPEVDLSSRPRVPEFHGDLGVRGKMSWKWTGAVRAEGVDSTDR